MILIRPYYGSFPVCLPLKNTSYPRIALLWKTGLKFKVWLNQDAEGKLWWEYQHSWTANCELQAGYKQGKQCVDGCSERILTKRCYIYLEVFWRTWHWGAGSFSGARRLTFSFQRSKTIFIWWGLDGCSLSALFQQLTMTCDWSLITLHFVYPSSTKAKPQRVERWGCCGFCCWNCLMPLCQNYIQLISTQGVGV